MASRLARQIRSPIADDAYTCGLLADMGLLVLAQFEEERYQPVYAAASHGPDLIELEESVFEFNHAQLGAHLLAAWGLPQPVVAAVAHHHNYPDEPDPLQDIVYAGNLLSDLLCDPETERLEAARQFLMDRFQMDSDGLMGLAADSVNDVDESASLFGAGRCCTIHESVLDAVRELISTSGLASVEG